MDIQSFTQRIENLHRVAGLAIGRVKFIHHGHQITTLQAQLREVGGDHRVFVEFEFHEVFLFGDGMSVIKRTFPDKGSFSHMARTGSGAFEGP